MMAAILLVMIWLLASAGFAMIAFSQQQHWNVLPRSRASRPPAWMRPGGWTLLILATVPAIWRDGYAFGLLLWTGMLTIAVLPVIAIIVYLRKRARR